MGLLTHLVGNNSSSSSGGSTDDIDDDNNDDDDGGGGSNTNRERRIIALLLYFNEIGIVRFSYEIVNATRAFERESIIIIHIVSINIRAKVIHYRKTHIHFQPFTAVTHSHSHTHAREWCLFWPLSTICIAFLSVLLNSEWKMFHIHS